MLQVFRCSVGLHTQSYKQLPKTPAPWIAARDIDAGSGAVQCRPRMWLQVNPRRQPPALSRHVLYLLTTYFPPPVEATLLYDTSHGHSPSPQTTYYICIPVRSDLVNEIRWLRTSLNSLLDCPSRPKDLAEQSLSSGDMDTTVQLYDRQVQVKATKPQCYVYYPKNVHYHMHLVYLSICTTEAKYGTQKGTMASRLLRQSGPRYRT